MEPTALYYFPSEGSRAGIEPANFGSNGKHTNHYTTEDDN
jgi:hypothetical protein